MPHSQHDLTSYFNSLRFVVQPRFIAIIRLNLVLTFIRVIQVLFRIQVVLSGVRPNYLLMGIPHPKTGEGVILTKE